ncbi:DUF6531 domain-containing protein [Pseudomonas paralcaligenes]|uniref:DUF6531 domain-containing protein n=1 Tax=Pseudomonas paralcaligenes TaxID=2772558 RepID=UPI001C80AFC0|nr:DUF6531 domain-containing protein [Pseudomonas paralcaligenes]
MCILHRNILLALKAKIMFCLFLVSACVCAAQIAPIYNYNSYATLNPDLGTHEEIWRNRLQQAYESCAAAVLARGDGVCSKFEPYALDVSPESVVINGYQSHYTLRIKSMNVIPLPDGEYIVLSERFNTNNLRIDLRASCPAGSLKRNISSNLFVCDCKSDECMRPLLNGPATPLTCSVKPPSGNPINTSNGNKFQREYDYSATAAGGIQLYRGYNSSTGLWSHNYSDRLEISNQDITLITSDGRVSYFLDSGTSLISSTIEPGALTRTSLGFDYISEENKVLRFSSAGKLISVRAVGRSDVQVNYVAGRIELSDSAGNSASLTEDSRYQPLSFSTSGLSVVYSYGSVGQLESVRKEYSGLVAQRTYHYEDSRDSRLLTGITDENGIRFATWVYDDKGRAISSEHAGGTEKTQLIYTSDLSTSIVNEYGKTTEYQFARYDGVKRISAIRGEPSANCPSSNSKFEYNSLGQLTRKTDNKNYRTTYIYNARGLESSRTEAVGTPQARTITTEWHPTFFLPLVVTEPKRIIRYQYDNQGRQLSRTVEAR